MLEYYTVIKNNERISFVVSWLNLEIIMLSEVGQKNTNIWYHLYVESKK